MSEIEHPQDSAASSWNPALRPDNDPNAIPQPQELAPQDQTSQVKEGHETSAVLSGGPQISEEPTVPSDKPEEVGIDTSKPVLSSPWKTTEGEEDFFDNLETSAENGDAAAKVPVTREPSPFSQARRATLPDSSQPKTSGQTEASEADWEEIGAQVVGTTTTDRGNVKEERGNIDPAWGLKRAESDTFVSLDHIERSPSFPPFVEQQAQHLPHSQAESMLQEAEASESYVNGDYGTANVPNADISAEQLSTPWAEKTNVAAFGDDEETSFFDKFNQSSEPVHEPSDAEARFEEGVPLVAEHDEEHKARETAAPASSSMDQLFSLDANGGDTSFFDETLQQEALERNASPTLERKDTSDVISSMHFEPHGSHPEKLVTTEQAPQEGPGEINVTTQEASTNKGSSLDDMWKAALGDDEFLPDDDDPLLSDEEEQSSFLDQLKHGDGLQKPVQQSSTLR